MRKLLAAAFCCLFASHVWAQSSPGIFQNQVPTPAQWNSFFSSKQDYIPNGPLNNPCAPGFTGLVPTPPGNANVFLNGNCTYATPGGGGNVSGPSSTTDKFIPQWNGATGTLLRSGLPTGASGVSTILQTDPSGHVGSSVIPPTSVSPGSYTNTNLTVGADGRVTAASNGTGSGIGGPGTSTDSFVPQWSGTSGNLLKQGLPVGNVGSLTLLQTDSSGHIGNAAIANLPGSALATGAAIANLGYTPLSTSANFADIGNASTARTNIGLGTGNSPSFTGITLSGLSGTGNKCVYADINGIINALPSPCGTGSGGVQGPGTSTNGFIPQWSGTGGAALGAGLPVGTSGASTIIQTDANGHVANTLIAALPNSSLANSSVTVGSTSVPLGTAASTVAGLTLMTPTLNGATVSGTVAGTYTDSGVITFSGSVAGTALTNYLASPAAIGGSAAAAGTFTALRAANLTIGSTAQTFPTSGILAGTTDTQTFTNKSIDASEINTGTFAAAQMLPLPNAQIYVGNGSTQPSPVTPGGDVTMSSAGAFTIGPNAVTTSKLNNTAVTYAKLQNASASTVLCNPTGTAASPQECTLGTGLSFSGSTLNSAGGGGVGSGTALHATYYQLNGTNVVSNPNVTYGGSTVGINYNAAALRTPLAGAVLQTAAIDSTGTAIETDAFAAAATFQSVAYGGTAASPAAVTTGTQIAGWEAHAYDGNSITNSLSAIRAFTAENQTSTTHGSWLSVYTTPIGSTTLAERVRFENDGGVTTPNTVTGGDKGAGTINAVGLYVAGQPAATLTTANTWTAAQAVAPVQLTDGSTITANLALGNTFYDLMASGATTLNMTGAKPGGVYTFYLKQGGAGSNVLTLGTGFEQPSCTFTLSTGVGTEDRFTAQADPFSAGGNAGLSCGQFQANIGPPSILSITQFTASTTLAASIPNAIIGPVSVAVSGGTFTGTLTITGNNTCGIVLSSSTLPANAQAPPGGVSATAGPHGNGLCDDWNIVATQSTATNSPFTQAEAATAKPSFTVLSHNFGAQSSLNLTSSTVSLNLTASSTLLVVANICGSSGGCTGTPPSVSSITNSNLGACAAVTGAHGTHGSTTSSAFELWKCAVNTTASSQTVTVTWNGSGQYSQVSAINVSGNLIDDGVGNFNTSTGTSQTVSGTGSTSQAIEFVFSFVGNEFNSAETPGAGQTLIDTLSSTKAVDMYYVTSSTGTITSTATTTGSTNWGYLIAAFHL